MQILYGEDTDADGTANRYLLVNTVGNMANVVSIRIRLLVRTIDDNLAAQTLLYSFNGVNNLILEIDVSDGFSLQPLPCVTG